MCANNNFRRLCTNEATKSEVRKWFYVRVVAFIECIIKVEHDLPVVRGEPYLNIHHREFRVLDCAARGLAALHGAVVAELQVRNEVEVPKGRHLKVRRHTGAVLDNLRGCLPSKVSAAIGQNSIAVPLGIDVPVCCCDLQVITCLPGEPKFNAGLLGVANIFNAVN